MGTKAVTWLFLITAILEVATGLLLLIIPSFPFFLLLGSNQPVPETLLISRLAGAALLVIGVICYLGRNDQQHFAQKGVLIGILIYHFAAAVILAYACISLEMHGFLLWPAVVLHAALALWCVVCIRPSKTMK